MKDIKSVLHLYLGCKVQWESGKSIMTGKLISVNQYYSECQAYIDTHKIGFNFATIKLSGIKPILSRLSDITLEDAKEINIEMGQILLAQFPKEAGLKFFTATQFMQLLSKGYWLFDESAFDSGVIIDKKTLK